MYKNQTNKMLAQDGVLQKGGTVDPVSGNDVPPGAMPEEVRDDVDAKLSEGEFVVPADVVRYIGLAKLMEMRDEAKRGLQKMTDIGQMGNSKKGAEGEALHGEEGEDEEFASSIDEIMSEEEGGEEEAAYAQGGYVPRASGYDPAESVSLYSRAPIKGFEMIPMSNDTGNTIYIPFINGKPQLQIPPGYVIKAKAGAEAATPVAPTAGGTGTTTTQGGDGGQDSGGPSGDTGGLPPASDRTDIRRAVLSIPDFMKFAPVVGTPITVAKAWAEKAAAADKAYLSPFEAPMVAAREAFTKGERDAAGLSEANAKMETARSTFTASERAKVINDIIAASITNKTDPEIEMDAMFAAFAPTPTAAAVERGVLSPGIALSPLAPETTKTTSMLDPAQAQQAKAAQEAADREAAQNAREAREAADREAAAQSARDAAAATAAQEQADAKAQASRDAIAAADAQAQGGGSATTTTTKSTDADFGLAYGEGAAAPTGGGGVTPDPGGCFLTTAAVAHMNEKDDGEVLSTLREFRDTYMKKNKEKSKDVAWYYENAPKIVKTIDSKPDAKSLYTKMYNRYIKKAYRQIKNNELEAAYETYKDGIDFAKKAAQVKSGFLATRASITDKDIKKTKTGFVPKK